MEHHLIQKIKMKNFTNITRKEFDYVKWIINNKKNEYSWWKCFVFNKS